MLPPDVLRAIAHRANARTAAAIAMTGREGRDAAEDAVRRAAVARRAGREWLAAATVDKYARGARRVVDEILHVVRLVDRHGVRPDRVRVPGLTAVSGHRFDIAAGPSWRATVERTSPGVWTVDVSCLVLPRTPRFGPHTAHWFRMRFALDHRLVRPLVGGSVVPPPSFPQDWRVIQSEVFRALRRRSFQV